MVACISNSSVWDLTPELTPAPASQPTTFCLPGSFLLQSQGKALNPACHLQLSSLSLCVVGRSLFRVKSQATAQPCLASPFSLEGHEFIHARQLQREWVWGLSMGQLAGCSLACHAAPAATMHPAAGSEPWLRQQQMRPWLEPEKQMSGSPRGQW